MIKNVKWFFVVLIISSLLSLSFSKESSVTERLTLGETAPELVFCNEAQPLNLRTADGNYTLLSFWASYDAASRERNATLSHAVESDARVKMISVSFDRYRSVFDAAIRQDKIDATACFLETEGKGSDIFKQYGLKRGFENYLVGRKGKIGAQNMTAGGLASYMD